MTLSELRFCVASVVNPRSMMPPLNVIAFSNVAQFVSDAYPWVNQNRDVRVITCELIALLNETFNALSTAPMGLPEATPVVGSPAKSSPTALLLASTMGEPESPGMAKAVDGAVG